MTAQTLAFVIRGFLGVIFLPGIAALSIANQCKTLFCSMPIRPENTLD